MTKSKTKKKPLFLIETCLETGPMTDAEMREVLADTRERVEIRAVMSLLECYIAEAGAEADARGVETRVRDEACGARRMLKELRAEMIEMTRPKPPEKKAE
jgi:hypothetical protein